MDSKVELLISLVNKGEENQQENALSIYNELMQDPCSFYFQLEEILRSNKNSLVKYQACNFMEIILRTKLDHFSQEQLAHMRQSLPELCEKLENEDIKHFVIIPMRLLKGCDQEWRDFYAKTTGKSYSLELAIQMHDHLDKDVMQQPIVNDTQFAFCYQEQLCNSPNKIAPIVFCKLIGLYTSLYPDRAEDIADLLPKILEMAKNSRQYDYYLFNIFWNQLGIIFSEISAQIPIFYDFANVAFEYSSDDSLNLYYRLVPLFMFGKTVRDISIDFGIKITNSLINLILIAEQSTTLLLEKFIELLNSLFACFEHKMICDFSVQKIAELQEINTIQSKITIGIIYLTLMLNYPNWLATHWSFFDEFLIQNYSIDGDETLLIIICNIIREMPIFFGFSIINFEHLIEIIQPLIISSNPDLRFTATQALIRLHDVIQVTITGIILPLIDLAPEVSDDNVNQYLYAVFKTLRTEYTFSEGTAWEVANFVVPLFTDDDLDVVDGSLYIAIELQCLSAVIRDEMKEITIAGIERLLNSEDIGYIANGIVHLADLLEVYPDEAVKTANEFSELIEKTIFDSEHIYQAQISIIATAKLASKCQFSFTQRIIEVGVEWLNSTEPCLVATGADIFQVICPHLDPAAAHQIIANMFDIAKTCTDIPTVAKTLLNVGRIFFGFGKNMPEDIKQLGIDAMIDYISGNFEVLGGVPPETTDISIQLMVIMLNQMKFCLTKPSPEVPEIFRFTMSLLKMGDLVDEGVRYVCLRILWVMIRYDILEPDYIQMITDLTIEQFTNDLPIIFLREEAHLITLYIVKKMFTREFIESKLDTIKHWWNYIYNNRQSTRPFAISMVQLIWVAVGQLKFYQELKDELLQTMELIEIDDFEENGEMVDLHLENFGDGSGFEEIDKQNILLSCILFCATDQQRLRMGISKEKTMELFEAQRNVVQKSEFIKKAVREFIGDNEHRIRILTPLL